MHAILKCYCGNHFECATASFVCRFKSPYKFPYMPNIASLEISRTDSHTLCQLLDVRINKKILWSTRFRTSTQKVESVNSAFKTTNPKHSTTFSRNGQFRDHSAIHMVNNGPGESILMKMEAVGLKPLDRQSIVTLRQLQSVRNYQRQRRRSVGYRNRRAQLRRMKYKLHGESKLGPNSVGYMTD